MAKYNNNQPYNPRLKALIMEVVDNQIKDNDPPETKMTFNRLVSAGYTKPQAKEKIGTVVVGHIYDVMKYQKEFDTERYLKELSKLK